MSDALTVTDIVLERALHDRRKALERAERAESRLARIRREVEGLPGLEITLLYSEPDRISRAAVLRIIDGEVEPKDQVGYVPPSGDDSEEWR